MINSLGFLKTYRWFLCIVLILLLLEYGTFAQALQNLEEQRTKVLLEIEETSRFLSETQKDQKKSLERLNLLNAQLGQFKRLIGSIDAEIAHTERQINETSDQARKMSGEIEKMKEEYARLIHHTYKNRGRYNKLVYVLSAKDFNEAYRRMKYFQQYSDYRKKQVAEIKVRQEELRVVMEQLAAKKNEKLKLLAEQQKESKRLEAVKTEQNKEVNSLKLQERTVKAQLTAKQAQERKLQNEIKKMFEAEAKKQNTTVENLYNKLTPEELLLADNFRGNRGRLPWPTERGIITGFFGNQPHPVVKSLPVPNNGIDITTVGGADVRVIFEGEVTKITGILGANMNVMVKHGSYFTVYSNLVNVSVKQGDKVKTKDIIGKVYTERGSNAAVLHFEIWEATSKSSPQVLNPELWLGKK